MVSVPAPARQTSALPSPPLSRSFSGLAVRTINPRRPLTRALLRPPQERLTVRSDPLSPERSQYALMQTMLRDVAHDMLSRRERKSRHHAVAAHLRSAFPDDGADVAEIIAAHYLDAYRAAATDPDADELRAPPLRTRSTALANECQGPVGTAQGRS